jgi:hypothetical protein
VRCSSKVGGQATVHMQGGGGLQPRNAELRRHGVCEGHMEGQSLAWSGGSEDTGVDAL